MTSLAFMLILVPAPPWIRSVTNWPCKRPLSISSQASIIALPTFSLMFPASILAFAAAFFTMARALINCLHIPRLVISKFSFPLRVSIP